MEKAQRLVLVYLLRFNYPNRVYFLPHATLEFPASFYYPIERSSNKIVIEVLGAQTGRRGE